MLDFGKDGHNRNYDDSNYEVEITGDSGRSQFRFGTRTEGPGSSVSE